MRESQGLDGIALKPVAHLGFSNTCRFRPSDSLITPSLTSLGVKHEDLERLSLDAAAQWTGTFNPRRFDAEGAREIYRWAL